MLQNEGEMLKAPQNEGEFNEVELRNENKMLWEYVQNLMQEKEKLAEANKQLAFANKELHNELLTTKEVIARNSKLESKIYMIIKDIYAWSNYKNHESKL